MTRPDDRELEELIGAYALDACDPTEAAEVEDLLARRPDLRDEVTRLTNAAAWIGATEALEAPARMRDLLLDRARTRRPSDGVDGPLRAYVASTARLADTIDSLDLSGDERTANGLTVRELVIHLAAQESLLAQSIGASPIPEITETDVPARTAAFVERFRDRPLADVREMWGRSVQANHAWALDPSTRDHLVAWLDFELPRDNLLVARAFENWIHRDDLLVATDHRADPPPPAEMHEMATLSVGTLPMGLFASDRSRPGKHARIVLTGAGGGDWLVAMGASEPSPDASPDVTVTADVVEWCRLAGERVTPEELMLEIDGDASLAADLVAAAPAFATL